MKKINFGNPIIKIGVKDVDHLIGQVFEHCELVGMTERQLKAYKASLRDIFWDWFNLYMQTQGIDISGLADPSRQARIAQGIEKDLTGTFN